MAEEKVAHWPDKHAAAATLGLSVRSVERLISPKQIRIKHRPILGRKPLTILNGIVKLSLTRCEITH